MNATIKGNGSSPKLKRVLAPVILAASMVFSPHLLHAQTLTVSGPNSDTLPVQSAQADTVVSVVADQQGLQLLTPDQVPLFGTFWLVEPDATGSGVTAPYPCPPLGLFLPTYQIADGQYLVDNTGGSQPALNTMRAGRLTVANNVSAADAVLTHASALADFITQIQTTTANQQARTMARAMGMDVPSPGGADGGDGGSYSPMFSSSFSIDTNALWLEITNVSNGWSYLNLHNGTNLVYAIWSTTNLLTGWQVETEVWPTSGTVIPTVTPFSVQNLNRQNLFVRAEDWTGIDSNGNGIPDWWDWQYLGAQIVAGTNLDFSGNGNTFAQDYSNNITPTVFIFTNLNVANNYVSSSQPTVQVGVAGSPYYVATLVDDNNFSNAVWNTYSGSSMTVNLGISQGWHDVWIGLRGHADNSTTAVWQYQRLKLDWTPPPLIVTGPTNGTVDVPMIQLTGYSPEALSSVSYDLSNAAGTMTNQQILILDQYYDANSSEFTTNTFQGFDITLTNGVNTFTLHATDLAGNSTTLVTNFTLNYSAKTNPPSVQITWPQSGTQVSGTNFTLNGQVNDPTAKVAASITDAAGDTNVVYGAVERNGKFWVEEIPLNTGTNNLVLTVTDAVGNTSVTNISVIQTAITFTMDDVTPDSQLWQATVNLTGKISDFTYAVWVNGVKGHNNGDGTWFANNVPVNKGGTASFTMTGYAPNEQQPDGSYGN